MLLIFITFLFIFLPRSVTSTWSHYCHKFPWIWVSSRKRPPTPACGCKTPPRRWRQRAGMAAKRTRINCCPTPAPRAVFIYMIDPLSNCVDNMALERLFSRSGASATSSATSASPTPSASPSTSRPSPSTPSTPWRVRTKQYIIEPSTNLCLVSYWPFPSSCLKCLRHFYNSEFVVTQCWSEWREGARRCFLQILWIPMYIVVRTEELYWSNCLWWR